MQNWVVSAKKAEFGKIAEKFNIDPIVARVIRNRDIVEEKDIELYLKGTMQDTHSYKSMKDMEKAINILYEKILNKKKILIIGDYDVDGITSTYILYKGISLCGGSVDTVIPHRIKDGYGINEELIKNGIEEHIDTILTCDNGIAAKNAFSYAKENNITCIITDHHEIPYEEVNEKKQYILPDVDAIVDPKQEDCVYPYKNICGAVVAYKLIEGLTGRIPVANREELLKELVVFAGIGTICDVMPLQDENRIFAKEMLKNLQKIKNIGLINLLKECDLYDKKISAYHIGFIIGPCINATGRLDTANISLDLLKSADEKTANKLAKKLIELNEERKNLTEKGVEKAIMIIKMEHLEKDSVLVIYIPKLHESLAGIIAGRIRELYGKPTLVITDGEQGIKGSARSIPAYHIYNELVKCSSLLDKFGGHAQAAGFSLKKENLESFRKELNDKCTLTDKDFNEKVVIDVPMPFSYVTKNVIEGLSVLEPFGVGNEKPVFAQKQLHFESGRILGKNANVAKFIVSDPNQKQYEAILFSHIDKFIEYLDEKYGAEAGNNFFNSNTTKIKPVLDVIYYPDINEYNGRTTLQFIIQNYK